MAPEAREITAFGTSNGHFEWLHMPFGPKSASITFQGMINTLLSDMLHTGVYAYLNDLLVCCKDVGTHLANLDALLLKLKDGGHKAKLDKC